MNNTALLIISITACLIGGIIKKYSGSRFQNKSVMYHLFNLGMSLVSAISLLVMGGIGHISLFTALLGTAFGIVTATQVIFTLKAYETGPFAYTAVIVTLSTIIPTLSGCVLWGEVISLVQIAGIVLMLVCMVCSVDLRHQNTQMSKSSLKWFLYVLGAFLCTGFIGVMQKWHQSSKFRAELGGFLILAFAISSLYSLISFLIIGSKRIVDFKSLVKTELTLSAVIFAVVCGICVAINNKLNLYLSGVIDSAVFFPVVNGSNLILTAIASVILFKEKLSIKKWIGFFIGIIAVILLCNPF